MVLQVRHPNYLGELLVQWSWVLPAAPTLGLTQLVPYYLPVVTTLMLVLRCVSFAPFQYLPHDFLLSGVCRSTRETGRSLVTPGPSTLEG